MTPIHRKHQQRPAAQLAGQQHCQDKAQVTGKSGDPAFRAAKHKQFWLCQDGPPQLQFCRTAALQRRACSCFGQAPARSARRYPKLLEKGQPRSGCLRPQAQIQGPKKRAVSRPQKWGREMDPSPTIQFGTQATLAHRQALNVERAITKNHDLRRQLSCGSDQHERNLHSITNERAAASDKPPHAQRDAAQSY